jgi:hypothetical protein
MEVKNAETEIENALSLQWQMGQNTLRPNQERFIEKTAGFLAKHPEASIVVSPQQYAAKEKEYILFYEAKKKYYLMSQHISAGSFGADDSNTVNKMSVRNPQFEAYLKTQVHDSLLFTIQEKCARLIGTELLHARFNQLNSDRERAFMRLFQENNVAHQMKFVTGKNTVPYNGFSFYEITYTGELPERVLKAYRKMNELNDEAPRKEFKEERQLTPGTLKLRTEAR